jgi:hypothetical protein
VTHSEPLADGEVFSNVQLRSLGPADWSPAGLSAREQVAEAYHRFAIAHDEGLVEVLASCFCEDAVYEVKMGAATVALLETREAIRSGVARVLQQQADQRRHAITAVVVDDLDLTSGTATSFAVGVVTTLREELTLGASVLYRARVVRDKDGCWRFRHFVIGMDAYAGTAPSV